LADFVLVSNYLDRDFLLKKGFKESQVLVTYGGVDPSRVPTKSFSKKYDAAWIGRLHPQKGIDDLFNCWRKVLTKHSKAKLVVIGEDNLKEYFGKQPYYGKLKKSVFFTGYLSGKELYSVLKSSKLFICPSYYESFGMVVAEAMICGLPVVAYELPVYKKIYTQGMVRVPIGGVDQLAAEVARLLGHPAKIKSLGLKAKRLAIDFRWPETAKKILRRLENNRN
jgi:glycosyltransferase involved in cell wall biosynthesis